MSKKTKWIVLITVFVFVVAAAGVVLPFLLTKGKRAETEQTFNETDAELAKLFIFSKTNIEGVGTGYAISRYKGEKPIVEFPSTYRGEPVIAIKNEAFLKNSIIISAKIPASINVIGEEAFALSSLEEVIFEENSLLKTIGNAAFACCALTSITIPAKVITINPYTFQNSTLLTSIIIPASVTTIGDGAFQGCTSLTSITIPSSVTTIRDEAFISCYNLHQVIFEEGSSLEEIKSAAFFGCSKLKSLCIPASVTTIGYVTMGGGTTYNRSRHGVFNNCTSLEEVTFEEGSNLKEIGHYAFSDTKLTSFTIPASVEKIGECIFSCAETLRTLIFKGGSKLTEVNGMFFAKEIDSPLTTVKVEGTINKVEKVLNLIAHRLNGSVPGSHFSNRHITLWVPSECVGTVKNLNEANRWRFNEENIKGF